MPLRLSRPLKLMRLYNIKLISTDNSGTKRATRDTQVSKRPDFFSYHPKDLRQKAPRQNCQLRLPKKLLDVCITEADCHEYNLVSAVYPLGITQLPLLSRSNNSKFLFMSATFTWVPRCAMKRPHIIWHIPQKSIQPPGFHEVAQELTIDDGISTKNRFLFSIFFNQSSYSLSSGHGKKIFQTPASWSPILKTFVFTILTINTKMAMVHQDLN